MVGWIVGLAGVLLVAAQDYIYYYETFQKWNAARGRMLATAQALEDYYDSQGKYPPKLVSLTTPVPYLTETQLAERPLYDPFSRESGFFAYTQRKDLYLLASAGPSGQISPELEHNLNWNEARVPEGIYSYLYDPTNGMESGGNLIEFGRNWAR